MPNSALVAWSTWIAVQVCEARSAICACSSAQSCKRARGAQRTMIECTLRQGSTRCLIHSCVRTNYNCSAHCAVGGVSRCARVIVVIAGCGRVCIDVMVACWTVNTGCGLGRRVVASCASGTRCGWICVNVCCPCSARMTGNLRRRCVSTVATRGTRGGWRRVRISCTA